MWSLCCCYNDKCNDGVRLFTVLFTVLTVCSFSFPLFLHAERIAGSGAGASVSKGSRKQGRYRSEIFIKVYFADLPVEQHMYAGDCCKPYRAAGQVLSFTHHKETQDVNESEREEEGCRGSALGGTSGLWRFIDFEIYFMLLFLTDTFLVCFSLLRSKNDCLILNLTDTCIHIKLHLVL